MDDSNGNYPRNPRMNEHLGVNKMGKNIRKSPLHQPNFGNPKQQPQQQQQQPQPQVYNISKTDFRSIVQQLTGSPSHHDQPPPPRPAGPRHNPPKPQSLRLQKIRPPPLSPITRPPPPPPIPFNNNSNPNPNSNPNSPFFVWPSQFSPLPAITPGPGDPVWSNTAESPISAYMRYLQNSMIDSGGSKLTQFPGQGQPSTSGLLPTPPNAPVFPSPRGNVTALLPSPSSQFPLPSPSSFLNLFSPRSPYPLPSPGFQYPLSPSFQFSPLASTNFSLSPLPQQASGILGPGPQQPPLSPSIFFPTSPSGFLPLKSPRWRE
ncbi:hypothetical protein AAC387_Pa08g2080 [Persea americana]